MLNNLFSGNDQTTGNDSGLINRQPCVAGKFYPGSANELKEELEQFFSNALPPKQGHLRAIVTPHAGYVFSGQVAATAFNQINSNDEYERIFLIGSSHQTYFDGASIYNKGNYITPLGVIPVDLELANRLIIENAVFEFRPEAHLKEHSLEVQLPFLQYHLKPGFRIVPIIIATQSKAKIQKISDVLKPFFTPNNLFVISSDFSHYPDYDKATEVDKRTAKAIASNSAVEFLAAIHHNETRQIPGLATAMCGWSAMLALLNITEKIPGLRFSLLNYSNSGDAVYGDKERVVGYWAIALHEKSEEGAQRVMLSDEDKHQLISMARDSIKSAVTKTNYKPLESESLSDTLRSPLGVFVSVYVAGDLRGCIGRFDPKEPLNQSVCGLAVSAATSDSRFSPVRKNELDQLSVELSVLTPLKKIDSIDEIKPGIHGIYVKKGFNSGTFLPQVAVKNNWNREEFLGYCSRDKARIGWNGWKQAEIYTFEAIVFGDEHFCQ